MGMWHTSVLGAFLFGLIFLCCEPEERTTDSREDPSGNEDTDTSDTAKASDGLCDNLESANRGCEFWAVDLPNISKAPLPVMPQDQQFAVVVANTSAKAPAVVRVYLGKSTAPLAQQWFQWAR